MTQDSLSGGISRRTFLQVSAAGRGDGDRARPRGPQARADAYEKFTWISPRGTLEVLDDYPYWSAKKMGYFDGLEHRHAARARRTAPRR